MDWKQWETCARLVWRSNYLNRHCRDDTIESDDDVASSSEEEVMSDDSAVVESDSDED